MRRSLLPTLIAAACAWPTLAKANRLHAVHVEGAGERAVVEIVGSEPPTFSTLLSERSLRIEFPGASWGAEAVAIGGAGPVRAVRQMGKAGAAWLELELSAGAEARIAARGTTLRVEVEPGPLGSRDLPVASAGGAAPGPADGHGGPAEASRRAEAERNAAAGAEAGTREEMQATAVAANRRADAERIAAAGAEAGTREEMQTTAAAEASRRAEAERIAAAGAEAGTREGMRATAAAEADRRSVTEAHRAAEPDEDRRTETTLVAAGEDARRHRDGEPIGAAKRSGADGAVVSAAPPRPGPGAAVGGAAAVPARPHAVRAAAAEARPGAPQELTYLGFKRIDGGARVVIRTAASPRFHLETAPGKLIVVLDGCRIPLANNRRPIDASFFGTAVGLIRPVEDPRSDQVRIEVALRRKAPAYRVEVDGTELRLVFAG